MATPSIHHLVSVSRLRVAVPNNHGVMKTYQIINVVTPYQSHLSSACSSPTQVAHDAPCPTELGLESFAIICSPTFSIVRSPLQKIASPPIASCQGTCDHSTYDLFDLAASSSPQRSRKLPRKMSCIATRSTTGECRWPGFVQRTVDQENTVNTIRSAAAGEKEANRPPHKIQQPGFRVTLRSPS